jgi:hypothetical protein
MTSYQRFQLLRTISSDIGRKCARDSKFKDLWNGFTHARRSIFVSRMVSEGISLTEVLKAE